MKTGLFIVAGYLVLVGLAELVSNTAQSSPVADTISQLPSPGGFLGDDQAGRTAFLNIAIGASAVIFLPKYVKAFSR